MTKIDSKDLLANLAVRLHELEQSHTVLDDDFANDTADIEGRLDDLEDDMQRLFEMMDGIKADVQTFAEMTVEARYKVDQAEKRRKPSNTYTNYINRGGCL